MPANNNTPSHVEESRSADTLRKIMGYQLVANELTTMRKDMLARLNLDAGEKLNITTEWGESLGSVSRGKVSYKAQVDDPAVVLGSADQSDMEWELAGTEDELIDFLLSVEGGTEFLSTRLSDAAMKRLSSDALSVWRKTGKAPAGWKITESAPTPRATATKLAKDMAADFLTNSSDMLALSPATTTEENHNA